MRIGFILTKTPSEEGFCTFIKFIKVYIDKEDINVYLLTNGVYCAKRKHLHSDLIQKLLKNCRIFAYLPDLTARGISENQLINGIQVIDSYDEIIVDIMEEMDQILSF
ncbi:MAG: sulfurtransferase complex subunit TusB [Methanobacteriaceae archaeon]|jgi:tRNA 2-thiouridine synthesizing protein B|nr:MAG: sulfurtransferase complex subunit TusB [Methanobacterium sp. BRmetb2]MCC7557400.1 sulfurtransferase complex subunit TusB [Methanobacteriaceae archaeon]